MDKVGRVIGPAERHRNRIVIGFEQRDDLARGQRFRPGPVDQWNETAMIVEPLQLQQRCRQTLPEIWRATAASHGTFSSSQRRASTCRC